MSSGTLIVMRGMLSLPVFAVVIAACAGGGGSIGGDYQDTQERAPGFLESTQASNKRSATSNEGIARTNENGGGAGGSGATSATAGFNCLGTFQCTTSTNIPGANTGKRTPSIRLQLPGVCSYQGSGFNPDGTITKDGQVIGSWQVTSTGFSITETATVKTSGGFDAGITETSFTVTLDCTKVSDSITGDDDDDRGDDDDIAEPPAPNVDAGIR